MVCRFAIAVLMVKLADVICSVDVYVADTCTVHVGDDCRLVSSVVYRSVLRRRLRFLSARFVPSNASCPPRRRVSLIKKMRRRCNIHCACRGPGACNISIQYNMH